ncbi:hypothetical protein EVAR_78487_1 [Eumeta japonica]|uniref:Uncharacterized protein n=1 Tax=Eumeta variegata TaxID=151549 RepID=A0A4C1TYL8_EUMVA|nr:hypothetical protein EVAR_78487_1 [Eumeta japonica]
MSDGGHVIKCAALKPECYGITGITQQVSLLRFTQCVRVPVARSSSIAYNLPPSVPSPLYQSTPSPIRYAIPTQEAGNALVTPQES